MASSGLLHFLLTVKNPTKHVDLLDLPMAVSAELVMDACDQLESDLRQFVCTEKDLLWRAQTRIMSVAGPDATLFLSYSPEHLAKLLLVYACKSKLKHKIIALIMKMGIQEQQQLMSIIKDAEMGICKKKSQENVSETGMSDIISDNERLRCRLKIAESEVIEWRRHFDEQSTRLQAELSARNEDCFRLKQQLATVEDELDIVKEQSDRIPALEQTIRKLEVHADETEHLRGQVHSLTSDLGKLQNLMVEKDSEIDSLHDRCKVAGVNRDLVIKQESEIRGLIAEKEALAISNNKLLDELNSALSDIRQVRQQLNQCQIKPSVADGISTQSASTDFLESEIAGLKGKLLANAKQIAADKREIQRLSDQLELAEDKNVSLLGRINSTEQKFAELNRVCGKLRKENESLHEMLTIDQEKASKEFDQGHLNDENSGIVLRELTNIINHDKAIDQNRCDPKKKEGAKKASSNDESIGPELIQNQQELQLISSALHNLVIEYQRRFLNTSALISSPMTSSNLPDSVSVRQRNRFRSQSVKSVTLNDIP